METITPDLDRSSPLRFSLLGSGSSGNAALIVTPNTKILIDSGLSYKRLCERAAAVGETLDGLNAVFITHEHSDHVLSLGTLSRKHDVTVYMTAGTFQCLPTNLGLLPSVRTFEAGAEIRVGDLVVTSFSVSHDAADPVSYSLECDGAKLGFATDLGHCCSLVRTRLARSNALVIESNYCPERLRLGQYPPRTQQRIRGRQGHLSNQDASSLLRSLLHKTLQTVVLVHISKNNNSPELVQQMAAGALGDHHANLFVALRDEPTPFFEVSA